MISRILVLQGPNLNLLGERELDAADQTLDALNHQLHERAEILGVELKVVQSNHEGALVDALQTERKWAEGVLLCPSALAWSGHVLAQTLRFLALPCVEAHLDPLIRPEGVSHGSVYEAIALEQKVGKGFASVLQGLESLAAIDPEAASAARAKQGNAGPSKQLGRKVVARVLEQAPVPLDRVYDELEPTDRPQPGAKPGTAKKPLGRARVEAKAPEEKPSPGKTIGRASGGSQKPASHLASNLLTRALVRQKISERLSGTLTPAELSAWARQRYQDVQSGAAAESGQRDFLESTLQTLLLSNTPASRLSDEQLIDLMAQLEG